MAKPKPTEDRPIAARLAKIALATRLRKEGLLWREVAERMGISIAYAHALATDPNYIQKRNRRIARQQKACDMCGAPITQTKNRRQFCEDCVAERKRRASRARWNATADVQRERRCQPEARERHRAQAKRYYASNRETIRAQRVSRVPTSSDGMSPPERADIRLLFRDPCSYCGGPSDAGIDHIVPIAHGGGGEVENLTSACFPCNRRKSDESLLHFMAKRVNA